MKVTKYLAIALAVVAVLAAGGWYLRNALIRSISNPLLQQYDIAVTDVSLDTLATRRARIGHLELRRSNGTVIAIEDLSLPVTTASGGKETYRARQVSVVTPAGAGEGPLELAEFVAQILSLPDLLAGTEILVDELDVSPYPAVHELQWRLGENRQVLSGTIDSLAMSATITKIDAKNYEVALTLPEVAARPGHTIAANMHRDDAGFVFKGDATLDLPAWMPVVALSGTLPDGITLDAGAAELRLAATIPYGDGRPPSLSASITPLSPWHIMHAASDGTASTALIASGDPLAVRAIFPTSTWTLQQERATLLVSYADWPAIPVTVTGLACQSGALCSMNSRINLAGAKLPFGRAARIELNSSQEVIFRDDGILVRIRPEAELHLHGLVAGETKLATLDARLASTAAFAATDNGWQFTAKSIDSRIETLALAEKIALNSSVFLEDVTAADLDQVLALQAILYAPSSEAVLDTHVVSLPGFSGHASLDGMNFIAKLSTVGLYQEGDMSIQHNLQTRRGEMSINDAGISFATKTLSKRVTPWSHDLDLGSGSVVLNCDSRWQPVDATYRLDGRASVRIRDLAGFYADTAFTGLSTDLDLTYNSADGIAVKPSRIDIALIEMGLPLANITADYALHANDLAVDIQNFSLSALGGNVWAGPFSFHSGRDTNNLVLQAESINLSDLLATEEFAATEVTGTIAATLPLTIDADGVSITDGQLTGEPPGGVIRYRPGDMADAADADGLGLVRLALSNFEYESLTSELDYSKEGELKLEMRLKGRNPDMHEARPIVLNLDVESNIRQMLKSLRAARSVEEVLEKRLQH